MGSTHYRSDVREKGARTASFSTIAAGALTCDSLVNAGLVTATGGISVPVTSYIKLGNVYLITANQADVDGFTNASINALASVALTGVVATKGDIPRGTLFLNASSNAVASNMILVKVGLASWYGQGGGSIIQD